MPQYITWSINKGTGTLENPPKEIENPLIILNVIFQSSTFSYFDFSFKNDLYFKVVIYYTEMEEFTEIVNEGRKHIYKTFQNIWCVK